MKRKNVNDDLVDLGDDDEEVYVNLTQKETYTAVTRDSFLDWKKKFDNEMAEIKKQKGLLVIEDTKPTGKQLFERDKTLANSDLLGKDDEEGEDVIIERKEEAKQQDGPNVYCYDKEIFGGEDEISFDPDDY